MACLANIEKIKEAKLESSKRRDSLIAQIEEEEKTMNVADAEIQANEGLLTKIEDFIPNKEVL